MNIFETISARRSVRTYDGRALTEEERAEINEAIAGATSPFGGNSTIMLADFDLKGPQRPGTYGVISGARSYLLLATGTQARDMMAGAYRMEQVVLRATALGLGTCWIGGTMRRTEFATRIDARGEELRIISPVGHPANRRRLIERITSALAHSRSRKPFDELFHYEEPGHPLPADSVWRRVLEMVRLAPSSVNSQPWRAVVTDKGVDFYSARSGGLAAFDMGIALCHFMLAAEAEGISGKLTLESETGSESAVAAVWKWQHVAGFTVQSFL